jgi:CheY-like chemotaxis protein
MRAVLESFMTPQQVDLAIDRALEHAGADFIPTDPAGFVLFVLGPLYAAVEQATGKRAADRMIRDLEPVLEGARHQMSQGRSQSGVVRRPTPPPPDDVNSLPPPPGGLEPLEGHAPLDKDESGLRRITPHDPTPPPCDVSEPRAPLTVLVVDDDAAARESARRALHACGYRVLAAKDGHIALAMCVRYKPDLVIADLDMAGVSGRQLFPSMRLAFGDDAPIGIAIANRRDKTPVGAMMVVEKPMDPQVLLDAVARSLGERYF